MTRAQEIESLRARLAIAMRDHKRKTAALLIARLQALVLRQINYEIRQERRAAS